MRDNSYWLLLRKIVGHVCCSTYIVPFLYISLMYLFPEFPHLLCLQFPAMPYFLPPEVIDEENFPFKITFLFSCSSNNRTLSLSAQFGFRLDIFLFSKVTNINIQAHPTWNAYPHKVIKACIIYLLKNLSEITKDE